MAHKLVLEEVYEGALVFSLAEEVSPVVFGDFAWTVLPGLEVLRLGFVDMGELVGIGAKDVGRGQDVRDVVMEAEVIVDDGMGNVVMPVLRSAPTLRQRSIR